MASKYILTSIMKVADDGTVVRRIQATHDIPYHRVRAGDLGGWVSSDHNLNQDGACWIADDAMVTDTAYVTDHAIVQGTAWVSGLATIQDSARVAGAARVSGDAVIAGIAVVTAGAHIRDGLVGMFSVVAPPRPLPDTAAAPPVSASLPRVGRTLPSSSPKGNHLVQSDPAP